MQVFNLIKRASTEQATSVYYDVLKSQAGIVSSKLNVAYTFIPCNLERPESVVLTPLAHADAENGVALFTTVVGWYLNSLDFSAVADLDAHSASSVAYKLGTLVRATESGESEAAYVCIEAHTSGALTDATFDGDLAAGYWQKLETTTFLKLIHTAAGSGKIMHATYQIFGS